MSTIALAKVSKVFGDLTAVDKVDLDVAAGEVVCLLGPSGCGKTTTLRMIAGLEYPSAGDVHIGGRRVNHLAPRDRDVAMVFQFYALYPTLTVAENLAYPLHAERMAAAEIAERVRRVSATLHLDDVLARRPGQLAEGERQRVAVGRAIIRDPSCFLFDEPLSRLDVQLREKMRGQIKEVLGGLNKATVIVTHDQLEALTMADRIAVMRDGLIEQCASPHEIFARPANLFVAGFIGTPQMNLLPAVLDGPVECGVRQANGSGSTRFRIDSEAIVLGVSPGVGRLPPGSKVTLGIRPRSIELIGEPQPDSIVAEVDLVEPMGAETLLHVVGPGRELRVIVDQHVNARVGERLNLRFKSGQTHVFDGSERRVGA
jgi:multiple sugar transport system ATP-binding protein